MKAAISLVREALGDDAVIINSHEEDGKVKITAALELPAPKPARRKARRTKNKQVRIKPAPVQRTLRELEQEDQVENFSLSHFLEHHGMGQALQGRIVETAAAFDTDRNIDALAKALDIMFDFSPCDIKYTMNPDNGHPPRPIMLVGPPGSGKTVTAAKLTSQAILSGQNIRLINTDCIRSGSSAQLGGYAKALNITVIEASEPALLKAAIETGKQTDEVIVIDSMGYNPFNGAEMTDLQHFIQAHDVEPLLVIAAGGDPEEAAEIAETYAALGVRRFIATRVDVARRYGSLLVTAGCMDLAFAGVGITPYLANGIERLDAMNLARLLTHIKPKINHSDQDKEKSESDIS